MTPGLACTMGATIAGLAMCLAIGGIYLCHCFSRQNIFIFSRLPSMHVHDCILSLLSHALLPGTAFVAYAEPHVSQKGKSIESNSCSAHWSVCHPPGLYPGHISGVLLMQCNVCNAASRKTPNGNWLSMLYFTRKQHTGWSWSEAVLT